MGRGHENDPFYTPPGDQREPQLKILKKAERRPYGAAPSACTCTLFPRKKCAFLISILKALFSNSNSASASFECRPEGKRHVWRVRSVRAVLTRPRISLEVPDEARFAQPPSALARRRSLGTPRILLPWPS